MKDKHWFVVQTKPRKERVAVENLERQGFTTYCPYTVQSKRRQQRWQKVSEPLFPRYLFVQLRIGSDSFSPIRSTLGVVGMVRFGSQPAVMPVEAIESIQQQEQEMIQINLENSVWKKGVAVKVIEGPFAGLEGIFQNCVGVERAILLLDLIGKQNRFTINVNYLATV